MSGAEGILFHVKLHTLYIDCCIFKKNKIINSYMFWPTFLTSVKIKMNMTIIEIKKIFSLEM